MRVSLGSLWEEGEQPWRKESRDRSNDGDCVLAALLPRALI